MVDIKDTSEEVDQMRRMFYKEYTEIDDKVPEGWSFEDRTVYSEKPALQKDIGNNKKISIGVMIEPDEINIMTNIQQIGRKSSEFNLLHQSRGLEPKEAVSVIVNQFIPKYEEQYID